MDTTKILKQAKGLTNDEKKLMAPDTLVDIQMNRYGTFDFDKSEKIIAIGHQKTAATISKFEQLKSANYVISLS